MTFKRRRFPKQSRHLRISDSAWLPFCQLLGYVSSIAGDKPYITLASIFRIRVYGFCFLQHSLTEFGRRFRFKRASPMLLTRRGSVFTMLISWMTVLPGHLRYIYKLLWRQHSYVFPSNKPCFLLINSINFNVFIIFLRADLRK